MKINKILSVSLCVITLFLLLSVNSFAADGMTFSDMGEDSCMLRSVSSSLSGDVVIPQTNDGKTVVAIDSSVFAENSKITSVTIPGTVKKINENAFRNCLMLKSVKFRTSVNNVAIKKNAFSGCEKLEQVVMPTKILTIPEQCFSGCFALSSIAIPEGTTKISKEAFLHCTSLEVVDIPSTLQEIESNAFYNCPALTTFNVATGNTDFKVTDGVLYSYDGKTVIQYPLGKSGTSFTVPDGVVTIGSGAFGYSNLKSVTLPSGVTEIEQYAFADCTSLSKINLPEGLTTIGENAFLRCKALESITIPSTLSTYESAFVASGLKNVRFTDGITTIPNKAFNDCTSLENAEIPKSVTTISQTAFDGCSALTIVADSDSYAAEYAESMGITTKEPSASDDDNNDNWLMIIINAIVQFFRSIINLITSLFA